MEVLESLQGGYLGGFQEHQQQHLAIFHEGFSSEKRDLPVFIRRTLILFFVVVAFLHYFFVSHAGWEAERFHKLLMWRFHAASVGDGDILAPHPSHTSEEFIEEAGGSNLTPGTTPTQTPHTNTFAHFTVSELILTMGEFKERGIETLAEVMNRHQSSEMNSEGGLVIPQEGI